ncbi:MAG TPA: hypothetical protein VF089_20460 [Candidatus Binatia bacterium]
MQETALSTSKNQGGIRPICDGTRWLLEKGDLQAREMPHIGLLIVLAKD